MPNRKLIRPSLAELKGKIAPKPPRQAPPDQTNAEAYYYTKQMTSRTPMVLVMTDGEILRGTIEWYDRDCVKVHRTEGPNLLVLKHAIKYMYKETGAGQQAETAEETF